MAFYSALHHNERNLCLEDQHFYDEKCCNYCIKHRQQIRVSAPQAEADDNATLGQQGPELETGGNAAGSSSGSWSEVPRPAGCSSVKKQKINLSLRKDGLGLDRAFKQANCTMDPAEFAGPTGLAYCSEVSEILRLRQRGTFCR